jgi:hypothetical protein
VKLLVVYSSFVRASTIKYILNESDVQNAANRYVSVWNEKNLENNKTSRMAHHPARFKPDEIMTSLFLSNHATGMMLPACLGNE